MLSLSQYNKLEKICHIRNQGKQFGGLQLILVGDFYQLPPVPNARYGDFGEVCFLSESFPAHTVYLTELKRQNTTQLIDLIREFSFGCCNPKTMEYISKLSGPLRDETGAIRPFVKNMLVDMHNRDCVLKVCTDDKFNEKFPLCLKTYYYLNHSLIVDTFHPFITHKVCKHCGKMANCSFSNNVSLQYKNITYMYLVADFFSDLLYMISEMYSNFFIMKGLKNIGGKS